MAGNLTGITEQRENLPEPGLGFALAPRPALRRSPRRGWGPAQPPAGRPHRVRPPSLPPSTDPVPHSRIINSAASGDWIQRVLAAGPGPGRPERLGILQGKKGESLTGGGVGVGDGVGNDGEGVLWSLPWP